MYEVNWYTSHIVRKVFLQYWKYKYAYLLPSTSPSVTSKTYHAASHLFYDHRYCTALIYSNL